MGRLLGLSKGDKVLYIGETDGFFSNNEPYIISSYICQNQEEYVKIECDTGEEVWVSEDKFFEFFRFIEVEIVLDIYNNTFKTIALNDIQYWNNENNETLDSICYLLDSLNICFIIREGEVDIDEQAN